MEITQLHNYQQKALLFAICHKNCILSIDMGLGKTLTMLMMLTQIGGKTLIVAPKRVAENTWTDEVNKWRLGLDIVAIKGTKAQRSKLIAANHNIMVISRENITDVSNITFDNLIIDELTSFKNIDSARTQKMISIKATRKIGLTGTFLANGAIDIYAQAVCCGLSFKEDSFKTWRAAHFFNAMAGAPVRWQKWQTTETIEDLLQPIAYNIFTLTAADWSKIPETIYEVEKIRLSEAEYKELAELDAFLATSIGDEVDETDADTIAIKEGAKFAKLQTYCNGFIYDDTKAPIYRGKSTKLQAVAEYITEMVEKGENCLVFYAYRYEVDILSDLLKKAEISANLITEKNIISRWNNGEIKVLFAHPASAGHGLNLQHGGRVCVWSTLTYNYEYFAQGCARLARQGQQKTTFVKTFIAADTCEERIYKAITAKATAQNDFLTATKTSI